ncbi:MAG TPA: glycosyltransferase family 87 protein, partial [Ktedonobacterales bacterium]|nr:glycosyltransferase family 87 protein [Ktedonobacterales bacterium]
GQANFVVLLLLLGGLWSLRAGRDVPAGLMTAGAAAIKMTPALLLVFLAWRRRWVALASAAIALAVLVVAGAAAAGWSSYVVYMERMVPLLSQGCAHWVNESLAAFFTRLVDGGDMFSWAISHPSPMTRALTLLASLVVVGVSFLLVGRRQRCLDLEFALLVQTTLFVSPLSWTHHSVLSLMSFLLVARHLARRDEMTIRMAGLLAISFTLVHVYGKPPGLLERGALNVLASYNLFGNLLLWGIIAMLLRREKAHAAASPMRAAG